MRLQDAETLLFQPARWQDLEEPQLLEFLHAAFVLAALSGGEETRRASIHLYEHARDVLLPYERLEVVRRVHESLERTARHYNHAPADALNLVLLNDPDFWVVATASFAAAQLIDGPGDDPVAGPRLVLDVAKGLLEKERQAAILAGLAALGDARVFDLLHQAWDHFAADVQDHVLRTMGSLPPTVAAIEFLIARLQRAAAPGSEGPIGSVVASLVRPGAAARGTSNPQTDGGVSEIERRFPSWRAGESCTPIHVRQEHPAEDIAERIASALARVASAESYPRLIPLALRAWGVEDAPFVNAVREAIVAAGLNHDERLLETPLAIEPQPDWDRHDAVVEWGILNPFGPTKVQLCLVPIDGRTSALVYALHHPFSHVCLLAGLARRGDRADVRRKLSMLAERFQLGQYELFGSLPHWVRTSGETGWDELSDAAAFFRTLHRQAMARSAAYDEDPDEAAGALRRLAADPDRELQRQFAAAVRDLTSGAGRRREAHKRRTPRARSHEDPYVRWFAAASAPEHVSAVSRHFLRFWNAAWSRNRGTRAAS